VDVRLEDLRLENVSGKCKIGNWKCLYVPDNSPCLLTYDYILYIIYYIIYNRETRTVIRNMESGIWNNFYGILSWRY